MISHRQGRFEVLGLSETECNLIQRVVEQIKGANVILISPRTKKGTLIEFPSDSVTTDAMHIPNTSIGSKIQKLKELAKEMAPKVDEIINPKKQNAISCPRGERPAEQYKCVGMPCQYPNCNCYQT